jgi:class 3 adenylate cyclase
VTTTVTTSVVFTDLVGSTELSARLGPVAAEEVRSVHFGLLRAAVATTGGTEVKNLGDGLMVVYPSLSGALDGAVAMQQNVERHNRKAAVPLGLRIGLSSGDATEEDGDFFGEPVVEAARLCDLAEGGQIVTTDVVRLQARRTEHHFDALGAVELKGLPETVDAYEVSWAPMRTPALVQLPGRLATTPAAGVVGRLAERGQLAATMKAAFGGDGHRLALLSGEPGIGKTTLAGDLAQRAHEDGATVLYGRCDEDLGMPYQPFVEALGDYVAHAPDSRLAALDERHLTELSRLVPHVRQRFPALPEPSSTDADAERYLLFAAITALLAEVAAVAPVVVVLDDLHWADKPTVLLLQHLVATLEAAEVLVVGTYRDSDLTASHPLTEGLAVLRRETAVERIAIGGLDDEGVVALVEGLAGHPLDGEGIALAHAVRRETDGNPFFTAELFRHLVETGAVRQEAGRWIAAVDLSEIGLPESVREVVGQRVRRLGDEVHQVLTMASVMGRDFDLPLLARVAERDEDDVLRALEEASRASVVMEVHGRDDWFTFTHGLFQQTLYEGLSATRRARTHRRIGELLEVDCGDDPGDRIGELAHHWAAATRPTDVGKAAGYARRAGERALRALAPDEAIRWVRQAVELLDADGPGDASIRLDALVGLGDAQRQAGDPAYRETLLEAAGAAITNGDTDRLVAAALAIQRGRVSNLGSVDTERIALLEEALAAVGDGDTRAGAWLRAALAAELMFGGDLHRVRALAVDAEAMARRIVDDATLLRVLNLTFLALSVPDGFARTVAGTEEALALAARVGDPVAHFRAAQCRVSAMRSAVDRDEMRAALDLAESLAAEIGQPYLTWQVLQLRCTQVLLDGDAEDAERLAGEALQVASDTGQPDALAVFGTHLAGIRWHQGRLDEIVDRIAQAASDNPALLAFHAAHALMLCECGRLDEARPLLLAARHADFHHARYDYTWLMTTTLWAETAAWLGDTSSAALLYERLSPFETRGVITSATFTGTVGMYLARLAGVLDRPVDGRRLFAQADAQLRALRAPFWHARNQVEWARLLSSTGVDVDRRHARELLAEATATAAAHGCAGVVRSADELARSL